MRILVTNDDSINSPGLLELVKVAMKLGEVIVVAPKFEQSAKSHAIDVRNGMKLEKHDLGLGVEAYSLDSTPADCVRTAYYGLKKEIDFVFSGINAGLNLGEDIAYSGTVAAISEAAMLGIRGIAFSSYDKRHFDVISNFSQIIDYILSRNLFASCLSFNVNVPNQAKGIRLTKQGSTHFDTRFEYYGEKFYQKGGPRHEMEKENLNTDVNAIYNNYISITPLTVDRTDYDALEKITKKKYK